MKTNAESFGQDAKMYLHTRTVYSNTQTAKKAPLKEMFPLYE